jgi:formyltetrahydrofolate hydrolase
MLWLLVTAKVVPSSPTLVAVMMEAIRSCETSVLARAIRHHIPKDGILHSHRPKNVKSYMALIGWAL